MAKGRYSPGAMRPGSSKMTDFFNRLGKAGRIRNNYVEDLNRGRLGSVVKAISSIGGLSALKLADAAVKKTAVGLSAPIPSSIGKGVAGFVSQIPQIPRGLAIEGEKALLEKMKSSPFEPLYRGVPQMSIETGKIHSSYKGALEEDIGIIEKRSEKAEKAFAEGPFAPSKAESPIAYQLGAGFGSLATAVLVSAATRNPTAASIAFGLHAKTSAYREMTQRGVPHKKASMLSTAAGITEGGLEYVGLQNILKPSRGVLGIVKSALIEGSQEAAQTVGSNFWAKMSGDQKRALTQDVATAAILGVVLGGGANTAVSLSQDQVLVTKIQKASGASRKEAQYIVSNLFPKIMEENRIISKLMEEKGAIGGERKGPKSKKDMTPEEITQADKDRGQPGDPGYIGKRGRRKARASKGYMRFTDPAHRDARDYTTSYGSTEAMHLPLEGVFTKKEKSMAPKVMQEILKNDPVKPSEDTASGLVSEIRPTREVMAKIGPRAYHGVYEPFINAERARYNWVNHRLNEQSAIWSQATTKEDERIQIAGIQRDNLANQLPINQNINKKQLKKYKVGEKALVLTENEERIYRECRQWLDDYQAKHADRVPKRKDYWPGLADETIMRNIRSAFPTQEELPTEMISFATRHRLDKGVARDKSAARVMTKYINAEGNDLYYSPLMEPTRNMVKQYRNAGKIESADYIQNYAERMVGFPGKLDRQFMDFFKTTEIPGLRKVDPHTAMKASQVLVDMQYLGGLGFKPSTAIRNLAQMINTGSEVGISWTTKGLLSYFKHPTASIQKARKAGLIEQLIPDVSPKEGLVAGRMSKLEHAMMWAFEKTEQFNRAVTYESAEIKWNENWAKYGAKGDQKTFKKKAVFSGISKEPRATIESLLEKGRFDQARQRYCKELVADTQYLYQKGESPLITRTQIGKQAWIFQTWWENYLEMFARWGKNKQWMNFVRHAVLNVAALIAAKSLGLELKTWLGASPIPELGRAERLPIISAPLPRALLAAANIPLQIGVSAMAPEEAGQRIPQAMKAFTKSLPIFVPGGTAAQQLLKVGAGKRQPIELLLPIARARAIKDIRSRMGELNRRYQRGYITKKQRDIEFEKLRREIIRRRQEIPKRKKRR